MNSQNLDISWRTIAKIFIAGICAYFLYLIKDLLVWLFFSIILTILFNPAIDFLQKRKFPRVLAVVFIYLGAFGILSFLIYWTGPLLVHESQQFLQIFPQYFDKIAPPLKEIGVQAFENLEALIQALSGTLQNMAANIFAVLFSIFGGIFSTLFVITIAVFLSLEEKVVERLLVLLFPKKFEAYALSLWEKCQKRVSSWFGTRILGCFFVGAACCIAFLLFNVKYPFGLAAIAGILDFIPIIGPLIAGIITFFIVVLDSALKAVFVLLFFILIQLIEGNVLTPILAKKFIGFPPVLVLIALAVGGKLLGIMGAILFVPLAGIIFEFTRDFLKKKKEAQAMQV